MESKLVIYNTLTRMSVDLPSMVIPIWDMPVLLSPSTLCSVT